MTVQRSELLREKFSTTSNFFDIPTCMKFSKHHQSKTVHIAHTTGTTILPMIYLLWIRRAQKNKRKKRQTQDNEPSNANGSFIHETEVINNIILV